MRDAKTDFGCIGDGVALDLSAFQAGVNSFASAGGGVVTAVGNFNLTGVGGLILPGNVTIRGEGRNTTILQAWHSDQPVVTTQGGSGGLEHLSIYGKGVNQDLGAFGGGSHSPLIVKSTESLFIDVLTWGGYYALDVSGADSVFLDVNAGTSYGVANVHTTGANWYERCKFDHAPTGLPLPSAWPFPAWQPNTSYPANWVVATQNYCIQYVNSGTSGASPPTLKNYNVSITDGNMSALLLCPYYYVGIAFDPSSEGENSFSMVDLSGPYANGILFGAGATGNQETSLTDCTISGGLSLVTGEWLSVSECRVAGVIAVNPSYHGQFTFDGCCAVAGGLQMYIAGGRSIITNNQLSNSSITVFQGADHYVIHGNVGATISDQGNGVKSILGNI